MLVCMNWEPEEMGMMVDLGLVGERERREERREGSSLAAETRTEANGEGGWGVRGENGVHGLWV